MKQFLAAALAGLAFLTPVQAADPAKYLPDEASLYVHINVKQLLTAPVIRKAIPLAFDKYGDQILPLMQMAKAFNPNMPDIPEDELKKGLGELKKEETIAAAFDKGKDVITDVVVAGDANDNDGDSLLIVVKGPDAITYEAVEAMTGFIPAGQVKIKKHKKDKVAIFEVELPPPANEKSFFIAVPEAGIVCFGMKKETLEAALERATGKAKPKISAEMTKLIAQRKPDDFMFTAGIKGEGDDREVMSGNLALDKDVAGAMTVVYATEEKAKKQSEELKEGIDSAIEGIKNMLGDKKDIVDSIVEKLKTKVDGKTVRAEFTLPGKAIEKLLSKDQ